MSAIHLLSVAGSHGRGVLIDPVPIDIDPAHNYVGPVTWYVTRSDVTGGVVGATCMASTKNSRVQAEAITAE